MSKKKTWRFLLLFVALVSMFGLTCCGKTPSGEKDSISFPESAIEMKVWETKELSATATNDAEITYSSGDSEVLYVRGNEAIGLKAGTATVTATAGDLSTELSVTVTEEIAEKPVLRLSGKAEVEVGAENVMFLATFKHGKTTFISNRPDDRVAFSYASDNTSVVAIDANGAITAKASGTANITVKAVYCGVEFTDTRALAVKDKYELSVNKDSVELQLTKDAAATDTIVPTVTKNGAAHSVAFTYESEKPEVATVSDTGVVTALLQGETSITVSATVDGKKLTKKVSVKVTVPVENTNKVLEYEFFKPADVDSAQITLEKLGVTGVDPADIIRAETDNGLEVATEVGGDLAFDKVWLAGVGSGEFDCVLKTKYSNYTFKIATQFNYVSSGLMTKSQSNPVEIKKSDVQDIGNVYTIGENVSRLDFTDQLDALDAKYDEGYRYLVMDVYFYLSVSRSIAINLGGTDIAFNNENVPDPTTNYYRSDTGYFPKNWLKATSGVTPFLIYDAAGNVVCDSGNYNVMIDGPIFTKLGGGTKDGKMENDRWYTMVVPLENRGGKFVENGFYIAGLSGCYVKGFNFRTKNPFIKEGEKAGKLYELTLEERTGFGEDYSDNGRRCVLNPWDGAGWVDLPNDPIEKTPDASGVYNVADLITQTPVYAAGTENYNESNDTWNSAGGTMCGAHWFDFGSMYEAKVDGYKYIRFTIEFDDFMKYTYNWNGNNYVNFNVHMYFCRNWYFFNFETESRSLNDKFGLSVFDAATKELILDGSKPNASGKALEKNKKYVFEYDLVKNSGEDLTAMFGIDKAKISDIVWAAKSYADSESGTEDRSYELMPEGRRVVELDKYSPVKKETDGTARIDVSAAINTADGIKYVQIGDTEQFTSAYEAGYTYVAMDLKFNRLSPINKFIACSRHVYFNAITGEITTAGHQDLPSAVQTLRIYDAGGNLVTGGLTAGEWYTFVFNMGRKTDDDFSRCTLEFREGFADCYVGETLLINGKNLVKEYPYNEYRVEHYLPDAEGYRKEKTERLMGKIGETVTAVASAFDRYGIDEAAEGSVLSGAVLINDALVLKVYYKLVQADYTVEYYKQKGTDFVLAETATLVGTIGETVTAEIKNYEDYALIAEESTTSGVVLADGSLVLKVYYEDTCTSLSAEATQAEPGAPLSDVYLNNIKAGLDPAGVTITLDGKNIAVGSDGKLDLSVLDASSANSFTGKLVTSEKEFDFTLTVVKSYRGNLYEAKYTSASDDCERFAEGNDYLAQLTDAKVGNNGVYDLSAAGFLTEPTNTSYLTGTHFLSFGRTKPMMDNGYKFVYFTANFTEFQVTSGHPAHPGAEKDNVNMFAYINRSWVYLRFNNEGKSESLKHGGVRIFKKDGTVMLDTINGAATSTGLPLETGTDYVFEFALVGGELSFCGFDKAVISDITLSKKSAFAVAENKETGNLYEVKHTSASDECERFVEADGYLAKLTDAKVGDGGVYDVSADGFLTEQTNTGYLTGTHFLSFGRTKPMIDKGYKFVRFTVKFNAFQTIPGGHPAHNMSNFNMFAYVNRSWVYLNFDNGGRSESLKSNGIAIYKKDGTVMLDAMNTGAVTGSPLALNTEYVFEMSILSYGAITDASFCGFDNSVISEITWSNKAYADII